MGGKLEEMRVERVDGVDRPATGHRWAIIKAEEAPESVEKDYAGTATAALEALLKEDGITFSKETADALHALAALLEMSVEFKSEAGEPGDGELEATTEDDDAPVTKSEVKALLKDALNELIEEELREADEDGEVEKTEPKSEPKSRQAEEQDDVEKGTPVRKSNGRPAFTDVIFGQ